LNWLAFQTQLDRDTLSKKKGFSPMPYASMLLQLIRAMEDDIRPNGFFFLIFNHED
jgi:hypothetical protein